MLCPDGPPTGRTRTMRPTLGIAPTHWRTAAAIPCVNPIATAISGPGLNALVRSSSNVYCGTVVRQLAALAQGAKGKVAAGVWSIAGRDIVCSSLTLAGVLYAWRATSQVSL